MNEAVKDTNTIAPATQDDKWTFRDALLVVGAFVVIIVLAIGGFLYYQSTKPPLVTEGVAAPDFTYPVFNGNRDATLSAYRGKVVLVNIWNTTCNECKLEMPLMEKFYRSSKGKPFEILAVATDSDGADVIGPWAGNLQADKIDSAGNVVDTEGNVIKYDGLGNTFKIDSGGNVVKFDAQGNAFKIDAQGNEVAAQDLPPVISKEKIALTFPILMDTNNIVRSIYQTIKYPESFLVDKNGNVVKIVIGRLTEDDFITISHMIEAPASGSGASQAPAQ